MQAKKLRALSLSERVDVRSFIEIYSDRLVGLADRLRRRDPMSTVRSVYRFNSERISYPFTADGRPSHGYKIEVFPWLRFGSLFTVYLRSWEGEYAWLKPSQLIEVGYGICVDTANLCTTLLRIAGLQAKTVIGVVKPRDNPGRFYGHAWTRVLVEGSWRLLETTIHGTGKPPQPVPLEDTGKLSLEYVEAACFDERDVDLDEGVWRRYDLTLSKIASPEASI